MHMLGVLFTETIYHVNMASIYFLILHLFIIPGDTSFDVTNKNTIHNNNILKDYLSSHTDIF